MAVLERQRCPVSDLSDLPSGTGKVDREQGRYLITDHRQLFAKESISLLLFSPNSLGTKDAAFE